MFFDLDVTNCPVQAVLNDRELLSIYYSIGFRTFECG